MDNGLNLNSNVLEDVEKMGRRMIVSCFNVMELKAVKAILLTLRD